MFNINDNQDRKPSFAIYKISNQQIRFSYQNILKTGIGVFKLFQY